VRKAQIPAPIYAENCNHKRQKDKMKVWVLVALNAELERLLSPRKYIKNNSKLC